MAMSQSFCSLPTYLLMDSNMLLLKQMALPTLQVITQEGEVQWIWYEFQEDQKNASDKVLSVGERTELQSQTCLD